MRGGRYASLDHENGPGGVLDETVGGAAVNRRMPHEADHQKIEGADPQEFDDGWNRMPGQEMGFQRYSRLSCRFFSALDNGRKAAPGFLLLFSDFVDRPGKARDLLDANHMELGAHLSAKSKAAQRAVCAPEGPSFATRIFRKIAEAL